MKATRYAIIFIISISPFLMINYIQARKEIAVSFRETHYATILEKAIEDATNTLTLDVELDENGNLEIKKDEAIETFFETLYLNFNILDTYDRERLKSYVPLILIIDYDGVYSYSPEKYTSSSGEVELKHILHDKKYYTEIYEGFVINMTLNDYYYVIDRDKNIQFEGSYETFSSLNITTFFDQTQEEVEQYRNNKVIEVIENELLRINEHNEYARLNGVNYDFFIPVAEGDLYSNTIDGIGFMATIQGLPMGDKVFNMFSLSGTSVDEKQVVYGYDESGEKVYHVEGCSHATGTLEEVFQSEIEAAKNGYFPCFDCN